MFKKRKRQLAAIMFTDIIGYSAMMNTNEQDQQEQQKLDSMATNIRQMKIKG